MPVEPGGGEQGRVDLAGIALGEPGFDIAADRHDVEVGADAANLRGAARRAGADHRAHWQRVERRLRRSAGRGRRRGAASPRLPATAGRSLSTSFIEWTEQSVSPASKARSSSLVHSALPPTSASGRSWMRSPLVRTVTIRTAPRGQPCASSSAVAVRRACASASGEPRVPRVNREVGPSPPR